MTFEQYVDKLSFEHRHNPNVKEFIDYAKYRWRWPFTPEEEAKFILAANDPEYSRAGIKALYKKLATERQERMVKFFQLTDEEIMELVDESN